MELARVAQATQQLVPTALAAAVAAMQLQVPEPRCRAQNALLDTTTLGAGEAATELAHPALFLTASITPPAAEQTRDKTSSALPALQEHGRTNAGRTLLVHARSVQATARMGSTTLAAPAPIMEPDQFAAGTALLVST